MFKQAVKPFEKRDSKRKAKIINMPYTQDVIAEVVDDYSSARSQVLNQGEAADEPR